MGFHTENDMRPAVEAWLRSNGYEVVHEIMLCCYCDLIGLRYAERVGRRIPPLECVAAIELKIRAIAEVRWQAEQNRRYAHYSYAAMPASLCDRMRAKTLKSFEDLGLGLLAVGDEAVEVVVQPVINELELSQHVAKRLWAALRRQSRRKRGELVG